MLFAQMLPRLACISRGHNGASFARQRFCSAIRSRLCSLVLRFLSWIVKRDRNSLLMIYKPQKNYTSQRHLSYICIITVTSITIFSVQLFVSPIPVIPCSFSPRLRVRVDYFSIYPPPVSTIVANVHDSNGVKEAKRTFLSRFQPLFLYLPAVPRV